MRALALGWLLLIPALALGAGQPEGAPSSYAAGVEAARALAPRVAPGKGVIVLRTHIDAYDSEAAENAFIQTMLAEYPRIPLLSTDYHSGETVTSAQRIAQGLFAAHAARLGGVFAASASAAQGACQAVASVAPSTPMAVFVHDGADARAFAADHPGITVFYTDAPALPRTDVSFLARQTPPPRTPYAPKESDRTLPDLNLELVAIPAGTVVLDKTRPKATSVAPFYIGRFEVTQAQWQTVMGQNPSIFIDPDRPVDNVSWNDAVDFCQKLTARERAAGRIGPDEAFALPTRAQWIYAALAGGEEPASEALNAIAWQRDTSGQPAGNGVRIMSSQPVGARPPNAFGLFDLYGNVIEWCADELPAANGKSAYHPIQGGCWWTDPQNCSAYEGHKAPAARHHSALGFRVALNKKWKNS